MSIRLEHANLTVADIDAMLEFLGAAFPEFRIRRDAVDDGRRWVHFGNDDTYIALNQATDTAMEARVPYSRRPGLNHLGYEVDDVESLRRRLRAAGYRDSTYPNDHPHRRRAYFYDPEGNDWEFVEYFSADPRERNDYTLPDRRSGA